MTTVATCHNFHRTIEDIKLGCQNKTHHVKGGKWGHTVFLSDLWLQFTLHIRAVHSHTQPRFSVVLILNIPNKSKKKKRMFGKKNTLGPSTTRHDTH